MAGSWASGTPGKSRGRRGLAAEINVTPLVDVMLVLLVVFMITAPLLTAGVKVDLPKEKAASLSQHDDKPLEITIGKNGKIHMGETEVTKDRLIVLLQAIAEETTDRRIYIRADKALEYGNVMHVMAAVNRAGFTKVALVSDPTAN